MLWQDWTISEVTEYVTLLADADFIEQDDIVTAEPESPEGYIALLLTKILGKM